MKNQFNPDYKVSVWEILIGWMENRKRDERPISESEIVSISIITGWNEDILKRIDKAYFHKTKEEQAK